MKSNSQAFPHNPFPCLPELFPLSPWGITDRRWRLEQPSQRRELGGCVAGKKAVVCGGAQGPGRVPTVQTIRAPLVHTVHVLQPKRALFDALVSG